MSAKRRRDRPRAAPNGRAPGAEVRYRAPRRPEAPTRPAPGQLCTALAGCNLPALPGRWVCARHAEALERRGAELQAQVEAGPEHRADAA